MIDRRQARRPFGIPRRVDDVGGHPHRRRCAGVRTARGPSRARSALAATTGSSLWLSTSARPWPGICLITPTTPADARPSSTARPSAATCIGSEPNRAVADDVGCALLANVEHRQAIDVDAGVDEASAPARGHWRAPPRSPTTGAALVEICERSRRGEMPAIPGGCIRATRPPSWSIRIGTSCAAVELAERIRQARASGPVVAIAPEQDVTGGVRVAEESALVWRQLKPGETVNRSLHWVRTATAPRSNFRRPPSASGTPASRRPAMPRAARRRIPPEKGTTILLIAATAGKRAESAVHARSAWA